MVRRGTRRRFLVGAGTFVAAVLAGCSDAGPGANETTDGGAAGETAADGTDGGTGAGSPSGESIPGDDYPTVEEWMTETEVGAADETYDGTILDARGSSTVDVEVGAEGNGDYYAFAPNAVAVSPGTTVRWTWTGEGGTHNVEAEPEEQIGQSDFQFTSGDPVAEAGTEYTMSFDEEGVALYHCEPHLSLGMKGAVVVAE